MRSDDFSSQALQGEIPTACIFFSSHEHLHFCLTEIGETLCGTVIGRKPITLMLATWRV